MWESYGLDNEDLLWAGVNFLGGIGGRTEAVCGALSASAVALGLRHKRPPDDPEEAGKGREEARRKAGELMDSFTQKYGNIICQNLTGIDLSDPEARRHFKESGQWEDKCNNYVRFVVEKLFELDSQ